MQGIDMKAANDDVMQPQTVAVQTGLQYECRRCSASDFKLYSDGHVVCSDCGAAMDNLSTTFSGDKHGPRSAA